MLGYGNILFKGKTPKILINGVEPIIMLNDVRVYPPKKEGEPDITPIEPPILKPNKVLSNIQDIDIIKDSNNAD